MKRCPQAIPKLCRRGPDNDLAAGHQRRIELAPQNAGEG